MIIEFIKRVTEIGTWCDFCKDEIADGIVYYEVKKNQAHPLPSAIEIKKYYTIPNMCQRCFENGIQFIVDDTKLQKGVQDE